MSRGIRLGEEISENKHSENEKWQKLKCCSYAYDTWEMNARVIPAIGINQARRCKPVILAQLYYAELMTRMNNIESFSPKLREARSRLYRRRFLQVNTRWKKLSPRSTQCTPLHRSSISKFQQKIGNIFSRLNNWISDFFHVLRRILHFFPREASMKSEKREKKNENRKMKTPVYDGEGSKISPSCPIWEFTSANFWWFFSGFRAKL